MKEFSTLKFIRLIMILVVADQLSKFIAVNFYSDKIFMNEGIAFSISFKTTLLIGFSLIVILGIIYAIYKNILKKNLVWTLFVAGAVGNLIDRVRLGAVIDFINLGWFPVFNIADVLLSLAAVGIIYFYILTNKHNEHAN